MAKRTKRYNNFDDGDDFENEPTLYALLHPDSFELVYVGMTTKMRERASMHLSGNVGSSAVAKWVRALREQGKEPIFVEIARFERTHETNERRGLQAIERVAIAAAAKLVGLKLLNRADNPLWRVHPKTRQFVPADSL